MFVFPDNFDLLVILAEPDQSEKRGKVCGSSLIFHYEPHNRPQHEKRGVRLDQAVKLHERAATAFQRPYRHPGVLEEHYRNKPNSL